MLRRTKDGVAGQLSVPPREELTRAPSSFSLFLSLTGERRNRDADVTMRTVYVPLAPAQEFWYRRLLARADTLTLAEIFPAGPVSSTSSTKKEEDMQVIGDGDGEFDEGDEIVRGHVKLAMKESKEGGSGTAYQKLLNLLMQLRKYVLLPVPFPSFLSVLRAY